MQKKKIDGSLIPVEPDTHKALGKVLKAGEAAKVMLKGDKTVFIMQKAEKGSGYDLSLAQTETTNDEIRTAFDRLKDTLK